MAEYFDVLTSIISKKPISDEDVMKHFSGWHTMTWLSNHPRAVWEANIINSARGNKFMSKLAEYKALKGVIKIPRNTFLKADKKDKHSKVILDVLMKHFGIGKTTAVDYFNILSGEQVLKILDLYARKNENQIDPKSIKEVTKIRDAIASKKKTLKNKE